MESCSSPSAKTFNHYKPSPAQHHKKYHVFLSFRGTDMRNTLVVDLFNSLSTAGFNVFVDSDILDKGKNTGVSLEEAIRDSTIHIPIFSADYARSPGCLDELSDIWNCKSTCTGTIIIPLFYKVEPSDVRYPEKEGPYAEAFQLHRTIGRRSEQQMDAWKEALHQISLLSGWSLAKTASGHEGRLVKLVVTDLLETLNITSLHAAKHLTGLSDRREEVTTLLKMDDHSGQVLTVGIWGTSGLGKTTLAIDIYNHIYDEFEESCFVSDVQAAAKESHKGLINLQEQILRGLAQVNGLKLKSVSDGKIQMKNILRSKKALVILDNVDEEQQLDALVGDASNGYWFGPDSRIIITTRDSRVWERLDRVIPYGMRKLDRKESVKLFCWHAFSMAGPPEGYEGTIEEIVDACQHLPLSLKYVGARLYCEENLKNWREVLEDMIQYDHSSIATPSAQSSLDCIRYIRGLTYKASVFNWGVISLTLGSYGLFLSTPVFWLCWSILVLESAMPAQTADASEDSRKPHRSSDDGRARAVLLKVAMSLALIAMLIYLEDLSKRQNKILLFVGHSIILLEGFPAIFMVKEEFKSLIQIPSGKGMQMIRSITEGQDWKVLHFFTPSVINAMILVTGGIVLGGNLGSLLHQKPYWIFVSIFVVDLIAEAVHQFDYGNRSDSIPERKPKRTYIVIVLRLIVGGYLCYCMTKEISQKSYFHSQLGNCDLKCQERSKSLLITMVVLGGLQAAETFTTALFIIYKFLRPSTSAPQGRPLV